MLLIQTNVRPKKIERKLCMHWARADCEKRNTVRIQTHTHKKWVDDAVTCSCTCTIHTTATNIFFKAAAAATASEREKRRKLWKAREEREKERTFLMVNGGRTTAYKTGKYFHNVLCAFSRIVFLIPFRTRSHCVCEVFAFVWVQMTLKWWTMNVVRRVRSSLYGAKWINNQK